MRKRQRKKNLKKFRSYFFSMFGSEQSELLKITQLECERKIWGQFWNKTCENDGFER